MVQNTPDKGRLSEWKAPKMLSPPHLFFQRKPIAKWTFLGELPQAGSISSAFVSLCVCVWSWGREMCVFVCVVGCHLPVPPSLAWAPSSGYHQNCHFLQKWMVLKAAPLTLGIAIAVTLTFRCMTQVHCVQCQLWQVSRWPWIGNKTRDTSVEMRGG